MGRATNDNSSPSGELLAKSILASFGSALERFERFWRPGWIKPAHERACVAKVATDLSALFGQDLEPWCEVSLFVLCQWKRLHDLPVMSKLGPVDLVLCNPAEDRILALVEFKTHHSIEEDVEKLIQLQKSLEVSTVIIVACQEVCFFNNTQSNAAGLDGHIQNSLRETPPGWQSAIDPDRPHVVVRGPDGGGWFVRPFVMWQSH